MSENTKAQYLAYQIETTNGTPALPNKFVPSVSQTVTKAIENIKSESRFNVLNNAIYLAKGTNKVEGSVEMEIDPVNGLPWFLLLLGALATADVSSATDGSVYKHTITEDVCENKSLTIESKKGGCVAADAQQNVMVSRAAGIVIDSLTLNAEPDNLVKLTAEVKGESLFDVAILKGNEDVEVATTAITNFTRAAGILTVTSGTHGLAVNDIIELAGNTPSVAGYYKVLTTADADTFTVALVADPGAFSSGGTAKKTSMWFFDKGSVKGLIAGDDILFYEKTTDTFEEVELQFVDEDNDVLAFDAVTSVLFTVANNTVINLVALTDTISIADFFSQKQVKITKGATIAAALASSEVIDFETFELAMSRNIAEKNQNLKNIVKPTGLDTSFTLEHAYENNSDRDIFRDIQEFAWVITLDTEIIISATDTNEETYKIVIQLPKVVFQSHEIQDDNNDMIGETLNGLCLYDDVAGFSTKVELYNEKIGTYYTA